MEKNLKNIKEEFKKNGIYYTTLELAESLKVYVDFEPKKVYDPTCGQGNLLSVFSPHTEKYGQELYMDELEKAKERLNNFYGYCGDTLIDDGFRDLKFDLIVANPPFSIRWNPDESDDRFIQADGIIPTASRADYAFLLHILWHLEEKGKAICLCFPGILYRGQREGKIRKWFIQNNYIERVVYVPGNTFVDTKIATCIIVLNKGKNSTDIIFEDRTQKKEKLVSLSEVEENDFNLSVSIYIQEEYTKEEIDPKALELHARSQFLKRLSAELEFEHQVCKLENISIHPFIIAIKRVADKYDDTENEQIEEEVIEDEERRD